MPKIKFTSALKRFFPDLTDMELAGDQLIELIKDVNHTYPGLSNYIIEESGSLREHVNIYIDGELIKDRENLSDNISHSREIVIFQAISGG